VAVEVDLPLDLELVIPLEIPMVLRLWLFNLGFPTLLLVLHVSFACKFSWIIHKIKFGFLGEVANHLRLGLAQTKNLTKEKLGLIKN
jgi:hypothetical protein